MKRVILSLLFAFLLTVNCFAVDISCDNFFTQSDKTYFGVFRTSDLTDLQKENLQSFLNNDLNLVLYSKSESVYYTLTLSNESGFVISDIKSGSCNISFNCSAAGMSWSGHNEFLDFSGVVSYGSGDTFSNVVIVSGKSLENCAIEMPAPTEYYVADTVGDIVFMDNSGLMSAPVEKEKDGVSGFLSSFWDSCVEMMKSVFVPSDNYFKSWYEDVTEAANEKFSGLTDIFNFLQDFFRGIETVENDVSFNFGADSLFVGSPAISFSPFKHYSNFLVWIKGILTGSAVFFTLIAIYSKVTTFFEK